MGWFLKRKKGRSAAVKRKTSEPWDRARTLQGLKWLASAAILIGLFFGWKYGQVELIGYAASRGKPVSAEQVELVNCPGWIHADVQRDLRWLASGYLTTDPMNRQGLDEAFKALAANAWLESIDRLERTHNGLRVHAQYRAPAALVMIPRSREHGDDYLRKTDRFFAIDGRGVRLPTDSLGQRDVPYTFAQLKTIPLPVIVGVAAAAPKAGQIWTGDDVQAGLSLAKLLSAEPYTNQIVAYDVAGRDTRKRIWLSLRTKTNGMVWWGLPPGQERTIEREAKVKMQWLAQISASREHRFQIDSGGRTVALFTEVPTILQPGEEGIAHFTNNADFRSSDLIQRTRLNQR